MSYNIKQKIEICLKSESNPEMTQADLAAWAQQHYGTEKPLSQTTISRILSSKNDLIASKETDFQLVRRRKQSNPLLRKILTEWITQAIWENIPITTPIIQSTANAIWNRLPNTEKDGNGIFNSKWCNHFIKKLNINLHGDDTTINQNPKQHKLDKVWKIDEKLELKEYLTQLIEVENYRPQDIFTIDEFKLFYSLPLDQIFDVSSIDKGLKQSSFSTENSLTIMLGCNIDGSEKLTPLVVGKYDKFDVSCSSSSSFKTLSSNAISKHNLMNKITETYNLFYKSNMNKWITSSMFQNYLLSLEHKMANATPNRKIVLILDDSSSHRIINLQFKNIKLCYLKNNTNHKNPYSSVYNGVKFDYLPMSFGIVEEFKIFYRLQQYLAMIKIQRTQSESNKGSSTSIAKTNSINMNNFRSMVNLSSGETVLSETDYQIPLIKVIEWIKRSWDSISSERIFLSWQKTHLFNFNEAWPASNPTVTNEAHDSLAPLIFSSSNYNTTKSYDKLVEVMKYLNVVIPWNVDDLLGLVNERGKITLSYVSIEEIIGSCLSEEFGGNNSIDNPDVKNDANTKHAGASLNKGNHELTNYAPSLDGKSTPLNDSNLLAHENWYTSASNQQQRALDSSLVSPSLSSVSSNSPLNTVPSASSSASTTRPGNAQLQNQAQTQASTNAQHSIHGDSPPTSAQSQLASQNYNGVEIPFPDFSSSHVMTQAAANFNTLLSAASAEGQTGLGSASDNAGISDPNSLYSNGSAMGISSPNSRFPGGSQNIIGESNRDLLSYNNNRRPNSGVTMSGSVKHASTNSVPILDSSSSYFDPNSRKHKLGEDNLALFGNDSSEQVEGVNGNANKKRQYGFSPAVNGAMNFSYGTTSQLNDSLQAMASSPAYQRGLTPLNESGVLSKAVFSGISYKSRSSSNLANRRKSNSSSASPNQYNNGYGGYSGSDERSEDADMVSILSKLISGSENSNSINFSQNTINELKLNLAILQNKYTMRKSEAIYPNSS